MNDIAANLRRTRADMLGTDDEEHYWHCQEAADEIERLQEYNLKLIDANVRLSDKVIRLENALNKLREVGDE